MLRAGARRCGDGAGASVVDEAGSKIVRAPAHVDLTVVGAFSGHDRSFRRAPAF
jgi:hypothetical protein